MESNHIITLNINDNGQQYTYRIGEVPPNNASRITGDVKAYMDRHAQANIWILPPFDWYRKHGFIPKELYEAKKQTWFAFITMLLSLIAVAISIFMTFH